MQQKCPSCGHVNRPGVIFCEKCGTSLLSNKPQPVATKSLDPAALNEAISASAAAKSAVTASSAQAAFQESENFPDNGVLRLEIKGSPEHIDLTFKGKEIILGRRDPATGVLPDVDLAPFAGYRMGVSRRHSQIRLGDDSFLNIFDLGSSNGTFLNGKKLDPNSPYRLNNHDEITLGQIVIRIHFLKATESNN
jgi:hypothetical protein